MEPHLVLKGTMSKQTKRKITVEPPTNKNKDSARRPSVFERLGTKATSASSTNPTNGENLCRHWVQNGNCPYGKICKYANTHTLISPSKRAAKKETEAKQKQGHTAKTPSKEDLNKRLHSTVVVKKTHSPDLNWENWDQNDLEYEDEKVLEKRRQLLQRELELQMKREKEEQQRQKKDKKSKKHSSSSSTSASSSSSTESSSSSDDSSSTSSSSSTDTRRRKVKSKKSKRESSSSASETDRALKKKTRARKGSVKGESPPSVSKKAVPSTRRDDQRLSTKRRDPSPSHRKVAASKVIPPSSSTRKRSLTPPGRSGSGHRRRSPSPSHSNNSKSKLSRSNAANKQSDGKHMQSRPNRSLSLDHKDKHNRSTSPRNQPRDRDRDRDREKDKDKDKEREREREKERERDKEREKEKEREREREKDRDKEKDRDRDRGRSRSPKGKGKSHSPRRNSRPPKDPRKRESPELGKDKAYRKDHDHGRNKDDDRKKDDRRSDIIDRIVSIAKDRGSRETTLERGGSRGGGKDEGGLSRDSSRKRDSQMLPGIVEKTAQDRDFMPKSRDHGDGDRDRDRDRPRDPRDLRDPRDPRDIRDPRDPRDRDSRDGVGKDPRDNLDPRLARDRGPRDLPPRNKDREDGLDRGHDRSRDRKDLPLKGGRVDYDRNELPSLLTLMTHPVDTRSSSGGSKGVDFHSNQKGLDKGSDRGDRGMDRERGLDRDRGSDRDRGPERDRGLIRGPDRDRGSDRDRGLDRGPDRDRGGLERGSDRDRGLERGLGRGHDRNMLRGSDRGMDRVSDRGLDRNQDRGLDRGSERSLDRGSERSFDRGGDRGPSDRGFDRGPDRNIDRGPPHMDRERDTRDNHSDRDYPVRGRDPDPRRQPPPPDDKGYDSPYDNRRGRDDRGRYADQMDRGRYDDGAPPRDDPRGMVDRRMAVDPRSFPPEDRRGRREGRNSLEPIRSRDPWDSRERDPRERDRERDPREMHERDRDPRDPDRRRGGGYDESRPPGPSIKGRDWDTRDYSDSRREWDGRGGRRGPPPDWEGPRHSEWDEKDVNLPLPHSMAPMDDDWNCFPGPSGDWPPGGDRRGGWSEEWDDHLGPPMGLGGPGGRPPPRLLPMRGDDSMMIITREVKMEGSPRDDRRLLLDDPNLDDMDMKDEKLSLEAAVKMDEPLSKKGDGPDSVLHGKRPRDLSDNEMEKSDLKKFCIDETPLEEDLSDISDDDADEILNREDSEIPGLPTMSMQISPAPILEKDTDTIQEERIVTVASSTPDASRDGIDSRSVITSCLEDRQGDDEAIDNLDFEEISDEELEEESKAGIGDALGVDWASLMAATRPKERPESKPGSARQRWQLEPLLLRIGLSVKLASSKAENLLTKLKMYRVKEEQEETTHSETTTSTTGTSAAENEPVPNPVASLQVAMREKTAKRRNLFASAGPYKRALSARRDIHVRRELCNLANVESTEGPQSNADNYLYRLSVQLFERSG